jgi:hypothetical protein
MSGFAVASAMAPVEGTRLAIPAMARSVVAATKTDATAPIIISARAFDAWGKTDVCPGFDPSQCKMPACPARGAAS